MGIIGGGLIGPLSSKEATSSSSLALSDGLACYTGSFSGVTNTTFSHNLNTVELVVEFRDSDNNLLIPDNWQALTPNTLEADFSVSSTGNVVIIGCIASGLSPITGGVTLLEGLSGIIDLDSSNDSIIISTSGQVINLNALFTPASGALLEQKCRDIDILSGLIEAGGGGAGGVTSINGISGTITLDSPTDTNSIVVNGQTIEIDGIFTWGSGQLLESLANASGVESLNGISGVVDLVAGNNGITVTDNGQVIELDTLFTYASGQLIDQNTQDIITVSGLIGGGGGSDAGQTSINGLSGTLVLTSPDGSILIGDGPQSVELSGLFTASSGQLLEQHTDDILTLSGLILPDTGQTSIEGVSGVVLLDSPGDTVSIIVNGQTIELDGIFTWASGQLLESLATASGVESLNGISGVVDLAASNNGITVVNNGQVIELSTLFTYASGQLIDENALNIGILSGLLGDQDAGQTSINGLSGVITLDSLNDAIIITEDGQTIHLSGLFTSASGQLVDNNTQAILDVSGLISDTQTSINGLSGVVTIVSDNNAIFVYEDGQEIHLSGLFTSASGQLIDQNHQDIITVSGLIGSGGGEDAGQTSVNGLSGALSLTSPDGTILIGDNGQAIELSGLFTPASGAVLEQKCEDINVVSGVASSATQKAVLYFTPVSGTTFVLEHGLQTEDFTFNIWNTNNDGLPPCYVIPENVYPSGVDHAVVNIQSPMSGKLVIVG